MSESPLFGKLADVLLMSDRYELRARLLPGMFAVLPLAILAFGTSAPELGALKSAGMTVAVEALLGVFAGHLSRALGRRREAGLYPSGLPTELWLASGGPRSSQQRDRWWDQVKTTTGLDISSATAPPEEAAVIRDAVMQLRGRLRGGASTEMLSVHNEEYGFARNLLGLTPVWIATSAFGASVAGVMVVRGGGGVLLLGVELTLMFAGILYAVSGPAYVRYSAERYAESFFAALDGLVEST